MAQGRPQKSCLLLAVMRGIGVRTDILLSGFTILYMKPIKSVRERHMPVDLADAFHELEMVMLMSPTVMAGVASAVRWERRARNAAEPVRRELARLIARQEQEMARQERG